MRFVFGVGGSVVESGRRLSPSRRCRQTGRGETAVQLRDNNKRKRLLTKPSILPILFEDCDRRLSLSFVAVGNPEVT